MKDKRINYIDVARGLGIFLVMIGHLDTGEVLHNLIYSFHMPFFFFLSGYLNKSTSDFKVLLYKKFKTLIVPYFFFGTLSIVIMLAIKIITNNPIEFKHLHDIMRLSYYNGNPIPMNKVIWFLAVLFWVEIFNYLLKKINVFIKIVVSCGIGYLLSFLLVTNDLRLPFGLDILPMALCFFLIGITSKLLVKRYLDKVNLIFVFLFTVLALLLINFKFTVHVDIMNLDYGNLLLLFICFVLGTLSLISLSVLIKKNSIIEFYGRNSLVVLGVHLILIRLLNVLLDLFNFNIVWYLQFLAVLIILYPIILFMNKYLPFFVGLKGYK